MTVSRSALDLALEAYTVGESTAEQRATIADAAQSLLDGESFDWCVEHGAQPHIFPGFEHHCLLHSRSDAECRFEAYIRIQVAP